jgi:inorganic pyrophosphatase
MRYRAAVFVIDKDKVLLFYRLKNGQEYYAVPGGGVEPNETPEQAAVRELKEETSLNITLGNKIGELEADDNHQYFYIAKSWSGTPTFGGEELERQSPANVYRLEWVPIETLNDIDLRKEARKILLKYLSPSSQFIGSVVTITIDRPLGSKHPKWDFVYPVNYGYVPDTKSGDGEEIDAYVLGVNKPLKEFTGRCIAVIHRLDDDDDKLILAPEGTDLADADIHAATEFQEQFFKSVIVR